MSSSLDKTHQKLLWINHDDHYVYLTYWGRVTHICVSKLTIIDSDNGLSSSWHQAIIWTNAGILYILYLWYPTGYHYSANHLVTPRATLPTSGTFTRWRHNKQSSWRSIASLGWGMTTFVYTWTFKCHSGTVVPSRRTCEDDRSAVPQLQCWNIVNFFRTLGTNFSEIFH